MNRAWILLLPLAVSAWGGTIYDFEAPGYNGSAGGTPLGGQAGWMVNTGDRDAGVYTYSGTGAPVPTGGDSQFAVLFGPNVQDDHSQSFAGSSVWDISFDILVHSFDPDYSSAGSFFLYNRGTGYELHAFPWYPGTPGTWDAVFDVFNSAGGRNSGVNPRGGFDGLQIDQWYQEQIVIDTALNQILSISIGQPGSPAAATYDPSGWYLYGGASAPFSVTGLGMFAYGTLAFDNIAVDAVPTPEPAPWALGLAGAAVLCGLRARKRARA